MRGTGCSGGAFDYFERAAGPRRLRRDRDGRAPALGGERQGRDARHLLRRDQPAVRRRDPAAQPGGDHAAVGDRRHADDALSGRDPQHRLRPRVGAGPSRRRRSRRARPPASPGPGSRSRAATRSARTTRTCTPRPSTCSRRSGATATTGRRSPIRWRRSPSSTRSTSRSSWPASGPTSRPAATARLSCAQFTGTDRKWFTFTNGTHIDSLDPETFNRWFDFLELYVAGRRPELTPGSEGARAGHLLGVFGINGVTLPDDPIQQQPDYASALAAFEALPPVRILFDNGAGGAARRALPGFERSFDRFPVPKARSRGPGSSPAAAPERQKPAAGRRRVHLEPGRAAADRLHRRHRLRRQRAVDRDAALQLDPEPGRAAPSPTSARRSAADTAVLGAGEVQVWVRSSARNVDLQATISEVRPDGKETFVQGGWLRTEARKLDPQRARSSSRFPACASAPRALPKGKFVKVTDPALLPGPRLSAGLAHPGDDLGARRRPAHLGVRRGRPEAHAVGGDRPLAPSMPSRLVLPVVRGRRADRPAALPRPPRPALPRLRAVRERPVSLVSRSRCCCRRTSTCNTSPSAASSRRTARRPGRGRRRG